MTVPSIVFVVARHRRKLFEALSQAFANDANVSVILDQRTAHRRRPPAQSPGQERRRFDRRERHVADIELRERGWTMIQLLF